MIDAFLDYLRYERNYSELTAENYGKDLKNFQSYFHSLDDSLSWSDIDPDIVRGWVECMMDKGNSATSINRRLSSLRSFYRYAMRTGQLTSNPARGVEGPRKKRPLPQFVREKEMDELLSQERWGDIYKEVRAYTILLVLYTTGLRLSELISLDDGMVNLETGELRVTGKGNKQRIIPFGEELSQAIQKFILRRDEEVQRKDPALFVTSKGKRMNRNQVRYEVQKALATVTTLKKKSPHVLRHSFATAMLNHDAGLESVRKLLGHESLTTTEVYTHATFEQLKRVYNSAHPRA